MKKILFAIVFAALLTVEVKNFDKNRWNECSTGIHCFITKREAELYR